MIKFFVYIGGVVAGLLAFNTFLFPHIFKVVKGEAETAIICVCITCVYMVVSGCVLLGKRKGR